MSIIQILQTVTPASKDTFQKKVQEAHASYVNIISKDAVDANQQRNVLTVRMAINWMKALLGAGKDRVMHD